MNSNLLIKKSPKLLSLLLTFVFILGILPSFNISARAADSITGYWTDYATAPTLSGTTYTITTAGQLAWIASQVNSSTSITLTGYTFVLANDIDLSAHYWEPIAKATSAVPCKFAATLDGGGHTITGMNINGAYINAGFVGNLTGTLKNINIKNCIVNLTANGNLGTLCGFCNGGTILNCSISGAMTVTSTEASTGGFAGNNSGTIVNSYTTCSVNATSIHVAGFAGWNTGEIKNCYSAGPLVASAPTDFGGFVCFQGKITNCYYWSGCGSTSGSGIGLTIEKLQSKYVIGSGTYSAVTLLEALNTTAASITNSKTWTKNNNLNNGYPVFSDASSSSYSVTYDGNGSTSGTVPVDSNSYANQETATVLDNTASLVKSDYSFAGWNTAADGSGTSYEAGSSLTITASITLYAQWTAASTSKALLKVTMITGEIKEYTVTTTVVQNFITWFYSKASSCPVYILNKNADAGAYSCRTEYLAYNMISSFEIYNY